MYVYIHVYTVHTVHIITAFKLICVTSENALHVVDLMQMQAVQRMWR